MYPTPGTKVFASLATAGGSAAFVQNGHTLISSDTGTVVLTNLSGGLLFLIVWSARAFANTTFTVTDSKGNIWTQLYIASDAGNAVTAAWYAQGVAAGANTITVTAVHGAGGAAQIDISVAEYSGLKVAGALDAFSNGGNTSVNITTVVPNDLVIFSAGASGGGAHATQAPWISDYNDGFQIIQHQIVPIPATLINCVGANSPEVTNGDPRALASFAPIGPAANGPIRGVIFINGRAFAVSGPNFFELFANGTFTNWGTVANDALPVTMAASPQQILIASAGTAYVFDLMANTLTAIPGVTFSGPVAQAGICDDFFLLTIQNSKTFYVSAPLNANDWVTNGSAIVSVFPDNIVSMLVFQRQVWFFSDTQSVVYYDSGNIFPFDVNPNAFIEAGCAAENSPAIFNNSIAWLGADARGNGKVWLASGYTPTRISNHAVEFAIQGYSRIDDVVGFSYQDQGHEFYCLYFPTPSVTWLYDALTGMWHQRGFWIQSVGQFRAAHYQNHMFAFGKHLVGDWQSGNVYQMNIPVPNGAGGWNFADDAGNPIRRVRRAPHISREQKLQFHVELQVFLESGLGPMPPLLDGAGKARGPQMMLRYSDDSGHSWSNELVRDCGKAGEFTKRVRWLQLGRTRDRIYEISMSDPVPWRVVDGYLQTVNGTGI